MYTFMQVCTFFWAGVSAIVLCGWRFACRPTHHCSCRSSPHGSCKYVDKRSSNLYFHRKTMFIWSCLCKKWLEAFHITSCILLAIYYDVEFHFLAHNISILERWSKASIYEYQNAFCSFCALSFFKQINTHFFLLKNDKAHKARMYFVSVFLGRNGDSATCALMRRVWQVNVNAWGCAFRALSFFNPTKP